MPHILSQILNFVNKKRKNRYYSLPHLNKTYPTIAITTIIIESIITLILPLLVIGSDESSVSSYMLDKYFSYESDK